ncbi:hypothetical protein OAF56_01180 [Pirellulaceae bacterium]|nr:hypothetical protein [Pirellulaceae bacterium]
MTIKCRDRKIRFIDDSRIGTQLNGHRDGFGRKPLSVSSLLNHRGRRSGENDGGLQREVVVTHCD